MGVLEYVISLRRKPKNNSIIFVGLDNAGKTTLLRQLSGEPIATASVPTQGFVIRTIKVAGKKMQAFDVGGQDQVRPYWRQYYSDAAAVVFVIDSSNRERLDEAYEELLQLLEEEKVLGAPLLIFANKQDRMNAISTEQIARDINIASMKQSSWKIQSCSAVTGAGVNEGMSWLLKQLQYEEKDKEREKKHRTASASGKRQDRSKHKHHKKKRQSTVDDTPSTLTQHHSQNGRETPGDDGPRGSPTTRQIEMEMRGTSSSSPPPPQQQQNSSIRGLDTRARGDGSPHTSRSSASAYTPLHPHPDDAATGLRRRRVANEENNEVDDDNNNNNSHHPNGGGGDTSASDVAASYRSLSAGPRMFSSPPPTTTILTGGSPLLASSPSTPIGGDSGGSPNWVTGSVDGLVFATHHHVHGGTFTPTTTSQTLTHAPLDGVSPMGLMPVPGVATRRASTTTPRLGMDGRVVLTAPSKPSSPFSTVVVTAAAAQERSRKGKRLTSTTTLMSLSSLGGGGSLERHAELDPSKPRVVLSSIVIQESKK